MIFVLSALPIFFAIKLGNGEPVRYYVWIIPLALIWVARMAQRFAGGSED